MIISRSLSQLQVSGFWLMKYIFLLHFYRFRNCSFFYKLISDIVPLGYILQTCSDSAPLQVISHNDLWMRDIWDQGKQESSVQKNNSTAVTNYLISKGFVKETAHLCLFCRWGNTQKVQNHSAKQEWFRATLWVSNLLSSLLPCHFLQLLLSNRSLLIIFGGIFLFLEWTTVYFDHLIFPLSLPKRCVRRWDFF